MLRVTLCVEVVISKSDEYLPEITVLMAKYQQQRAVREESKNGEQAKVTEAINLGPSLGRTRESLQEYTKRWWDDLTALEQATIAINYMTEKG